MGFRLDFALAPWGAVGGLASAARALSDAVAGPPGGRPGPAPSSPGRARERREPDQNGSSRPRARCARARAEPRRGWGTGPAARWPGRLDRLGDASLGGGECRRVSPQADIDAHVGRPSPTEGSDSSEPLPPPMAKPRSKRSAASWLRVFAVSAPSTTTIRRRPKWLALATTLKPAGQVKPVFMPSAPG